MAGRQPSAEDKATLTGLWGLLLLPQFRPAYMIAARIGVHPSRLSEYSRGRRHIPDRILIRMCEVFDCPPEDILRPFTYQEVPGPIDLTV